MKDLENMSLKEIEKYKEDASEEMKEAILKVFDKYKLIDEFFFITGTKAITFNRDIISDSTKGSKINKTFTV